MRTPQRCPWAITYGVRLTTRCALLEHDGMHTGYGLKRFPYQRVHWAPGDIREFLTERTDEWSWEA